MMFFSKATITNDCAVQNEFLVTWYFIASGQRAKKVVSDSSGLMGFVIGLVNHVFNLPEGQVKFLEKFKLQKICNQCCSSKIFLGYLKDSWASTYCAE